MKDIRDSADLNGLWAAIPMPWTPTGSLDERMLCSNAEALAAARCDGVYTSDSDGEFYALELSEFRQVAAAFAGAMAPTGCGVQIGVTWTNTQGIIDRIKVSLDQGVSTVHVCYPFWMPLNSDDVWRFWDDLAEAAPQARWIHYSTPRGHVRMTGKHYARLAADYPEQFIGTKLCTQNFVELSEVIGATPGLAHFVTDFVTVPAMMLGARGVYSFWVNTLPCWTRLLMDLCDRGGWAQAMALQGKFNRWECECVQPLVDRGYLHGVVGKARCAASGFLQDDGFTRAPYQPVPQRLVDQLKQEFDQWWAAELAEEALPARGGE